MCPRGRDRRVPGDQPQFQPANVESGQQHHAAPEQPPGHAFGESEPQSEPEPEFDTPFHLCCAAGHIGPGLHQPDPGAAHETAFLPGDLTAGEFILAGRRRLTDNVHFPVVQPDGYGYFNVPPKLEVLEITQGGLAQCEI